MAAQEIIVSKITCFDDLVNIVFDHSAVPDVLQRTLPGTIYNKDLVLGNWDCNVTVCDYKPGQEVRKWDRAGSYVIRAMINYVAAYGTEGVDLENPGWMDYRMRFNFRLGQHHDKTPCFVFIVKMTRDLELKDIDLAP